MQLYLLYEERLGEIPEAIKVLQDYGKIRMVVGEMQEIRVGKSMVLEGSQEAFVDWLKPFDHVWLGEGQPCEENFRVAHIKADPR